MKSKYKTGSKQSSVRMIASGFWEKSGAFLWPRDRKGEGYMLLVREHYRLMLYCFGFVFASGFGQTFFISLFQNHWQKTFELTAAEMGSIYGIATLCSGLLLPFAGKWLDRTTARVAGYAVILGLFLFCLAIASSTAVWMLAVSLFGLRFFGQGMSSSVGATFAARWFDHNRGRAVSLSGLGYPVSEAIMPLSAVLFISWFGWRLPWVVSAILIAISGVILIRFSLRDVSRVEDESIEDSDSGAFNKPIVTKEATSVWKDYRLYLMLGIVSPLPFMGTGIIFFQAELAESRGWSASLFPTGFLLFAVVRAFVLLSAGAWADRLGALRLVFLPGIAFALGILCLMSSNPILALGFFFFMGMSFGISGGVMTPAFSELFGKDRVGTVRGATGAVAVFLTAASPALFGWLLSIGVIMNTILFGCFLVLMILPLSLSALLIWRVRLKSS